MPRTRAPLATAIGAVAMIALAPTALAAPSTTGSDFRVLPYQQSPAPDGMLFTWFSIVDVPGQIEISGPGLGKALILPSVPALQPILDYQAPGELTAGGEFPFATTAIFAAPGVPARNWKHSVHVTGLASDTEYAYVVTQGSSSYANTFRTAPAPGTPKALRIIALSDSETLVLGRTRFREWNATTPQIPGSSGRPAGTGPGRNQYFVTETLGYRENIKQIEARDPDLILMPGDLIEGTAVEQQRRWDEFWRHNAGEYDDLLSGRPIYAAIGNNCIFNGTAAPGTNENVQYARQQWSAYWDWPANGDSLAQDLYYRADYGPITIITLCSVGAMGANDNVAPPPGQDVNVNFPQNLDTNRAWLNAYPFGDIPDFNVGTAQWNWAVKELAAARAAGQIIIVQWHHTPFSRGVHGSSVTSNQSGEAMRIYAPLMEQYRVAAVLCGHSEVSEQSWFDLDGDGYGVHLWDVGAAGDGLRGVEDSPGATNPAITAWRNNPLNPAGAAWVMNPHHRWSADQSEAENWVGNRLVGGGKHYGFLELDLTPLDGGDFELAIQYWHNFPLNDGSFQVTGFELRGYDNRVVLRGPADDLRPIDVGPTCARIDLDQDGKVTAADLTALLAAWGSCGAACAIGDINADGVTDAADLAILLGSFGTSCGG